MSKASTPSGHRARAAVGSPGLRPGHLRGEQIAGLNPPVIDEMGIPRVTTANLKLPPSATPRPRPRPSSGRSNLRLQLGGNGKSQILGDPGFVKLVRQKDGPVVGVHMIGARMASRSAKLNYLQLEALPSDVAQLIHAHPTQNEAWRGPSRPGRQTPSRPRLTGSPGAISTARSSRQNPYPKSTATDRRSATEETSFHLNA